MSVVKIYILSSVLPNIFTFYVWKYHAIVANNHVQINVGKTMDMNKINK